MCCSFVMIYGDDMLRQVVILQAYIKITININQNME